MKFYFENAQEISDAISLVEKDLGFSQASLITDADLTVRVDKTDCYVRRRNCKIFKRTCATGKLDKRGQNRR